MKKIIALLLVLSLSMFLTIGCGNNDPAPADTNGGDAAAEDANGAADGEQLTIAFSTKTITDNEFQRIMVEGAQAAVEAAGHEFVLTLAGGELDVSAQINNIEDLITMGVDGIIVVPMDGEAIVPVLRRAYEAGIPVVLADSNIAAGNDELYVTFVGTDNYKVGLEAAARMIEAVGEGEVIMVRGASGSFAGDMRAEGFKDGLEGSSVVLADEQAGNWMSEVAMQVTENMLQGHPNTAGIFLASDGMLPGVLSAVELQGLAGQLSIISVDGEQSALDQVEAGYLLGTVGQFPGEIGATSVQVLLDVLTGARAADSFERFMDSGLLFMYDGNMEEARRYAF